MADHYRVRDLPLTFLSGQVTAVGGSSLNYRWSRSGAADGTLAVGQFVTISDGLDLDVWSTGAFTEVDFVEAPSLDAHTASSLLHPQQLGYVEITAGFSTASTTLVDVTGLQKAGVVVGARPLKITLCAPQGITSTVAADTFLLALVRGATLLNSYVVALGGAGQGGGFTMSFNDNPAAGTYTYKIQMARLAGTGTGTLNAVGSPYFTYPSLRLEEVAA